MEKKAAKYGSGIGNQDNFSQKNESENPGRDYDLGDKSEYYQSRYSGSHYH